MEGYVRALDARRAAVMVAVGAAMSIAAVLAGGPGHGRAEAAPAVRTAAPVAAPICWLSPGRDDPAARSDG